MTDVLAWAVKGPDGKIDIDSVSRLRSTATFEYSCGVPGWRTAEWTSLRKKGCRVVRVRVIEDTND